MKQIAELGEIEYIENLPLLRILNLLKNPIQVRDHLPQGGDEGFLELFFKKCF